MFRKFVLCFSLLTTSPLLYAVGDDVRGQSTLSRKRSLGDDRCPSLSRKKHSRSEKCVRKTHISTLPEEILEQIFKNAACVPSSDRPTYFQILTQDGRFIGFGRREQGFETSPFYCKNIDGETLTSIMRTCAHWKRLGLRVSLAMELHIMLQRVKRKTLFPDVLYGSKCLCLKFENDDLHAFSALHDLRFLKFGNLRSLKIDYLNEQQSYDFLATLSRLLDVPGLSLKHTLSKLDIWANASSRRTITALKETLSNLGSLESLIFSYNNILVQTIEPRDQECIRACQTFGQTLKTLPLKTLALYEEIEDYDQNGENRSPFFYMDDCFPETLHSLIIHASDTYCPQAHIVNLQALTTFTLKDGILSKTVFSHFKGMINLEVLKLIDCKTPENATFELDLPELTRSLTASLKNLEFSGHILNPGRTNARISWPQHLKRVDFFHSIKDDATLKTLAPLLSNVIFLDIRSRAYSDNREGLSAEGMNDFLKTANMQNMSDLKIGQPYIHIQDIFDGIEFVKANKKKKFPNLKRLDVSNFEDARERLIPKFKKATEDHFGLQLI